MTMTKIEFEAKIEDKEEYKIGESKAKLKNVFLTPLEFENFLSDYILSMPNLSVVFQMEINDKNYSDSLKPFVPKFDYVDRSDLKEKIQIFEGKNSSYYSFFAEALMPIILNRLFNWKLKHSILDFGSTPSDGHNGIDVCMVDVEGDRMVFGEAKFYKEYRDGIKHILFDLEGSIRSKMNKFISIIDSPSGEIPPHITDLKFKKKFLTYSDIKEMKIIFAGFCLHNEKKKYNQNFDFEKKRIIKNLNDSLELDIENDFEFEIIIIHIPIKSKKDLIIKLIEKAKYLLEVN